LNSYLCLPIPPSITSYYIVLQWRSSVWLSWSSSLCPLL
jgi:hypothetical protein